MPSPTQARRAVSAGEIPSLSHRRSIWPLGLVGLAMLLFGVATVQYPGGYAWLQQSISSAFQPQTAGGVANTARPVAVAAVLSFCLGIGFVFHSVSRRGPTRLHRKTIQIAGVGSMVYGFLVVSPMHDVLVGVTLVFFLVAMLATFHMLWLESRLVMLLTGMACVSGTVWNATIYFSETGSTFLPIVQKVSIGLWVVWLLTLYFSRDPASRAG